MLPWNNNSVDGLKKCIATLSLVKNSEDKKKINYAVENPEDFKKLELSKWREGRAAATECRTSRDPVTDRDFQPEKKNTSLFRK
jgi:hypothetical protein